MQLNISRRTDGRLIVPAVNDKGESEPKAVATAACFPWSKPGTWISLRDDKGKEVALIEKLEDLDEKERGLIEEELLSRGFIPVIQSISSVDDAIELFHWKVTTQAGQRMFLTNRNDVPRELPSGAVLIKDVAGDLLLIPNVEKLDEQSQKLLWTFLD